MSKQTGNKTNEKKSFKDVIVDNRGKIIATVGVITTGVVGYIAYKYKIELNAINERTDVVESAIVEGCIIDQARATVIRKRDYQLSKLNAIMKYDSKNGKNLEVIKRLKGSIESYDVMLKKYDELEKVYSVE